MPSLHPPFSFHPLTSLAIVWPTKAMAHCDNTMSETTDFINIDLLLSFSIHRHHPHHEPPALTQRVLCVSFRFVLLTTSDIIHPIHFHVFVWAQRQDNDRLTVPIYLSSGWTIGAMRRWINGHCHVLGVSMADTEVYCQGIRSITADWLDNKAVGAWYKYFVIGLRTEIILWIHKCNPFNAPVNIPICIPVNAKQITLNINIKHFRVINYNLSLQSIEIY